MSRDRAFGVLGGFLRQLGLGIATRMLVERTEHMVMGAQGPAVNCNTGV
jgi:hypothetical protein